MKKKIFTVFIDVDAVKRAHRIESVISKYLPLIRKGGNYVGLCPFHPDKHPSLRVSEKLQVYHCFACGAKGDVIHFVQEIEHCSFVDAVSKITGGHFVSPAAAEQPLPEVRKVVLKPSTERENAHFLESLLPYDPGEEVLREVYTLFGVGIAPWQPPRYYKTLSLERMGGRLIFPIHDAEGRLVGFSSRRLRDDNPRVPKYLNSSLSDGFDKSSILYGWHVALPEIRRTQAVYVVEGYKDALALHAVGLTNCVALCGTAFTHKQAELLCSQARQIYLLMDGDAAGLSAAMRIEAQLREQITCHKIRLPRGQDPDSLLLEKGVSGLRNLIGVVG
jgi:DNA primase